ncbi:M23 family metallopeptidase [Deinococcus ruber]|uniref:Peptidase M23 n=1 Tax=Deinococcus ruber TaxID=1848197 RepID=A0A918F3B7_9DEIO|nr:M23 family metallopeptidase [Deinococcus ruber]GGQ97548.1 peptidase M23 [Deinococcus ruber]
MKHRGVWVAALLLTGPLIAGWQLQAQGQTVPDPNAPASSIASDLNLPTTSARLKQLLDELNRQQQASAAQKTQLEALRQNIAQLSAQQQAALGRIDRLSISVANLETKKRQLDLQIQLVQQQINDLRLQIQGTESRVSRLQQDVRYLLVSLYRERSGRYLQLLSQADSLSDLLIRARYANISGQNNVRVVQSLKDETERLKNERAQQAAQAQQLQGLQATQVQQLQALTTQRQEQNALVARLQQDQAGKQTLALQTQAQQALTSQGIQSIVSGILQERNNIEADRQRRIEAERQRRQAELERIRAAQEAARREAARLAAIRAEQERQAKIAAELARQRAEQARIAAELARQQAEQARIAAARAKAQAEAARRQELARQAQAAAEAEQARQRKAQQDAEAAQVRQQQAALQAQRDSQARQDQVAREQQTLQARQKALQDQNQQAQAQSTPLPSNVGSLEFPLPGGRVSAPYFTSGGPWTVIAGAEGQTAVAVAEGNVLSAANYANLGWVIVIDHGALISTSFGLSETMVNTGDRVTRGQAIGVVGGSPQFGLDSMVLQLNQAANRQAVRPPF